MKFIKGRRMRKKFFFKIIFGILYFICIKN